MFFKKYLSYIIILTLSFISIGKADRVIRDAEMEAVISELIQPIVEYAKLPFEKVKIRIIENDQFNAFATYGMQIYIYSGVLSQDYTPSTITGILAHEIGHITGNHLYKTTQNNKELIVETLGIILLTGVASAASSGKNSSDVLMGSATLAAQLFERKALRFSRIQEYQADNFALSALQHAHYPYDGFLKFFKSSRGKESALGINSYTSTHPTGQDRVENIERFITSKPPSNQSHFSKEIEYKFRKAVVKFKAYLTQEVSLIEKLVPNMSLEEKQYAYAIFYHHKGELSKAAEYAKSLLEDHADNPFYHELYGQILYDQGFLLKAKQELDKAQNVLSQNPLINMELAMYEIQLAADQKYPTKDKSNLLDNAISRLKFISIKEEDNTAIFSLLGRAYGEKGEPAIANFYLAKEAFMSAEYKKAILFASRALKGLDKDSAYYWEAESILQEAEQKRHFR